MNLESYEDILNIEEIIKEKDLKKLSEIMKKYNLEIKDGKLLSKNRNQTKILAENFDFRQYATKILLNSVYGSLLNQHMKFADNRIGQSVTMTGRCITKHMNAKINEILTGEYDHEGKAILYGDTDSVTEDTKIITNVGEIDIKDLFDLCEKKYFSKNKEYARSDFLKVASFDKKNCFMIETEFDYIYRHYVDKEIYQIKLLSGNTVKVTEDHSLVYWNNKSNRLMKFSPKILLDEKKFKKMSKKPILIVDYSGDIQETYLESVVMLGKEYNHVYDIGISKKTPWFFANRILVHNSSYFSAYHLKEFSDIDWTKENSIKLYDEIARLVNESFNEFMKNEFNVREEFANIRAAREIVASKGYFITKKRYALLCFDKEGKRLDKNGKLGEIKAMGLELKRSDTPIFVQKFLEELLYDILSDKDKNYILSKIKKFKKDFRKIPDWQKGYPKKVNKLEFYTKLYEESKDEKIIHEYEKLLKNIADKKEKIKLKKYIDQLKSPRIPGHVMASINWNEMKKYYKDYTSSQIVDGAKVLVFFLKKNVHDIKSIALPFDIEQLPEWLKNFQVDTDEMENTIVNKKLKNLFSALEDWNIDPILDNTELSELFEF